MKKFSVIKKKNETNPFEKVTIDEKAKFSDLNNEQEGMKSQTCVKSKNSFVFYPQLFKFY